MKESIQKEIIETKIYFSDDGEFSSKCKEDVLNYETKKYYTNKLRAYEVGDLDRELYHSIFDDMSWLIAQKVYCVSNIIDFAEVEKAIEAVEKGKSIANRDQIIKYLSGPFYFTYAVVDYGCGPKTVCIIPLETILKNCEAKQKDLEAFREKLQEVISK